MSGKPHPQLSDDGSLVFIVMGGRKHRIPMSEAVDLGREILAAAQRGRPVAAPKTMDPAALTDLREGVDWNRGDVCVPQPLVVELLADRDHHAAEVEARGAELERRRMEWAAILREQAEELALECDRADELEAEVERLRPLAEAPGTALALTARELRLILMGLRGRSDWHPLDLVGNAPEARALDARVVGALAGLSPRASEGACKTCGGTRSVPCPGRCAGIMGRNCIPCGAADTPGRVPCPDCADRASEGAATPTPSELDASAEVQLVDQYAALGKRGEPVELPGPDDMHGACDGMGGSDYP